MTDPQVTIVVVPRERFSYAERSLANIYEQTTFPFKLVYVSAGTPMPVQHHLEREALRRLLSDRGHYDRVSAASREAALAYASNLGLTPVEQYLEGLAAVPMTEPYKQKADKRPECLENLSPEKLELLAWLLRKNKGEVPELRLKKDITS